MGGILNDQSTRLVTQMQKDVHVVELLLKCEDSVFHYQKQATWKIIRHECKMANLDIGKSC